MIQCDGCVCVNGHAYIACVAMLAALLQTTLWKQRAADHQVVEGGAKGKRQAAPGHCIWMLPIVKFRARELLRAFTPATLA